MKGERAMQLQTGQVSIALLSVILLTGCPTDRAVYPAPPWALQEQGLGQYCTPGSDPVACSLAHCIQVDVDRLHHKLVFTNTCEETLYIPLTHSFYGGDACS
jgi:hypothetical protein